MIHIALVFLSLIAVGAAPPSSKDPLVGLHRKLMTSPKHDTERFADALKKYLFQRSLGHEATDLADVIARIGVFTVTEAQKIAVFRVLGSEDSGLSATEVVDIMMSDAVTEYGVRMWASSAFQKLVDSFFPLEAGHVSKRQMEIFSELAKYTDSFEDWEQLAMMPGNHNDVRPWVSRVMVVEQLDRLWKWPLKMKHWRTIFSYYEPEFHDTDEKNRLLERFENYTRMLMAVETVADWRTRADLQDMIIRRVRLPSQGIVRTVLSPIGKPQPLVYQAYLDKLRAKYLDRARKTDCEHLVAAWSTQHPMVGRSLKGPRELPRGWRVIDNGD